MRARFFRFCGSAFFTLAGLAYLLIPPRSSAMYFDSSWPAKSWGLLFLLGGIISLWGVLSKSTHTEKLGVAFVAVATLALALNNGLLMFADPIVWTRLGGGLFYLACSMWALERWDRLGKDVVVMGSIAGDEPGRSSSVDDEEE